MIRLGTNTQQEAIVQEQRYRIYRSASGTPDSLTPRPGIDDTPDGGLSFWTSLDNPNLAPGKYVEIDPALLSNLQAIFDNLPEGHVTIKPATLPELRAWAVMRGTGLIHPFTQELLSAITRMGKK